MNEPKIRFNGFEGEWEETTLSNSEFSILAGGDIDKSIIKEKGKYPVIANALTSDGIIGYYDEYYRIKAPAVTVTGRGEIGHAQARHYNFTPVVRLLTVLSPHNVDFLANAIECCNVFQESTGVPQLTTEKLKEYSLKIPSLPEQQAIASYFTHLDTLITSSASRLASLKQLKAASLQAMFPQEGETVPKIRFKGFEGEWEEKRLGEMCSVNRGVRLTRKDLDRNGTYPVYQNTNYPLGYYNSYNVCKNNPYVIIGGSAGLIGYSCTNFWAADDCAYFGKNDNLNKFFLYNTLVSKSSEIQKNVRGASIPRLDRNVLSDLKIHLPSLPEQQTIASYFTSLDKQISLQTQRLEKLKQIKSACLDKMFA